MRSLFLSIFIILSGVAATLQEVNTNKKKIVDSLDINGSEKKTLIQMLQANYNLRAYKENYFLPLSYRYDSEFVDNPAHGHSSKNVETEFQVSLQYDFATNLLGYGEIYGFGYTQRSWWQVYVESAFFRETNYQPEIFMLVPMYPLETKTALKAIKIALIHQSNGRGGDFERSWNRVSLYGYFAYRSFITELEIWYRFKDSYDYNPDLLDYIGYGQLRFIIPYKKHLCKIMIRSNIAKHKSAVEMMYSYPLPAREKENDLFLFIKTFNGYGESLIDYNHHVNKVSIGVAISR